MKLANNATSTLAASIGTTDTSISIQSADAAKFPSLLAGEAFPLTLIDPSGNREICRVTARSGSALTVVRGAEGTAARAFPIGSKAELRMTAAVLDDKVDNNALAAALATKAAIDHTHTMAAVTDLAAALALKANVSDLPALAVPAGSYLETARSSAPPGYLKANGAAVSRTTYAALFAAIGTTYGAGDGSTTFNLPDLRGEFVRGLDDGRGVDPGRPLGSVQSSQNLSHNHGISDPGHAHATGSDAAAAHQHTLGAAGYSSINGVAAPGGALKVPKASTPDSTITSDAAGYHAHTVTVYASATGISLSSAGGSEARPRNIAALICIKY